MAAENGENSGDLLHRRAAAIRLPRRALAHSAGLNKHTVYFLPMRKGVQKRTFDRIERALVEEELRLRDYLLKLHPLAEREARPEEQRELERLADDGCVAAPAGESGRAA